MHAGHSNKISANSRSNDGDDYNNDIDFDNGNGNYTVMRMIIINSLTRNENNIPIS